jgi:hypothetical protein
LPGKLRELEVPRLKQSGSTVLRRPESAPTCGKKIDETAIDREAARLRKRVERVKAELKQLARNACLLP